MPLKEGKCINCGSLLMLDPSMPKGHCPFCDCVFDNEEAFRAFQHPEEFTFPNDPQPPYTGPSLVPLPYQRGPVMFSQGAAAVKKKDDFVLPKRYPRCSYSGKLSSHRWYRLSCRRDFCAITIR